MRSIAGVAFGVGGDEDGVSAVEVRAGSRAVRPRANIRNKFARAKTDVSNGVFMVGNSLLES